MILVLDTDVIVAGFRSPTGAAAELLRLARQGRFKFAISIAMALEYEAVATRPAHLRAMGVDHAFAVDLIAALLHQCERTRINFRYRPQTRDPDDEMVLETAVNATADAIVTFNRRDFQAAVTRFGIGCWLPREALERIR